MQPAARSLAGARHSGDPMPEVRELGDLVSLGFRPRKGQILMIAGMPGSQKSGFALWLTERWGLETLYFSADMAQHTATVRLAGCVTGHTKQTVATGLKGDGEDFYLEALESTPINFVFDSTPSYDDIAEELACYVELYDAWPEVIVIDNLINVSVDHDNEWSALRMTLIELQAMARLTGALIVVLHHMAEGTGDPTVPAPRKSLHGKVSQIPELILSVAVNPQESSLLAALVKNRDGPADATGKQYRRLAGDFERTRFSPWTGSSRSWGYQGEVD